MVIPITIYSVRHKKWQSKKHLNIFLGESEPIVVIFTANGDRRMLTCIGHQKSNLIFPKMVMAQIIDPLPNDKRNFLLCCYVNATSHIQIARITNIPNWYFERVVFPGQRLVFEGLGGALVEIHSGMMASSILSDTIPCERLAIDSGDEDDLEDEQPNAEVVAQPFLSTVEAAPVLSISKEVYRKSDPEFYPSLRPVLA